MIQCPNCKQSVPDWVQRCQFCQTELTNVARPIATKKPALVQAAAWIYPTYYTIAGYFVLSGALEIIQTLYAANAHKGVEMHGMGPIQVVMIIIGAITSMIGLGLILKVEIVRGIVNIFCWLRIATSVLGLPAAVGLALILGPIGIVALVMSIFDIITGGLMIYLLGETD